MRLGRLTLAATPLVLAAAFAAMGARAQTAAGCGGGRFIQSVEVARVIDGRSFLLADGLEVRLAAIETLLQVPGDEDAARTEAALPAKMALETLVHPGEVSLFVAETGADRYGRLTAYASVRTPSGEALVQHELVAGGHALVSPAAAAARRAYLRNVEQTARSYGLGLWSEPYSVVRNAADPADILADQGRFTLVHGKVASVRGSADLVYINFGQRWSDQFTATLLKRHEGAFASADVAPKMLGHTVEVGGWIEEHGGPAIEVTRPEQIEIIQ